MDINLLEKATKSILVHILDIKKNDSRDNIVLYIFKPDGMVRAGKSNLSHVNSSKIDLQLS